MLKSVLATAVLLCAATAFASDSPPPGPTTAQIEAGLAAYKTDGAEAAIKKLLEGGPLEGSREAINQSNMLHAVEGVYGSYRSWDLVREVEISPTTRFSYVVMNYEQGPLFCAFTLFNGPKGWRIVNYRFHTEPTQAWPPGLLAP